MTKAIWPVLRTLATIFLLYFAFSKIDFNKFTLVDLNFHFYWLLLAILAIFFAYLLGGLRWYLLMKSAGFNASLYKYEILYLAGGLINQGIPSTLGGDSYRAIKALNIHSKTTQTWNKNRNVESSPDLKLSFSIMILDRFMGLAGNNVLGGIGLMLSGYKLIEWGYSLGLFLILITLLVGVLGSLILNLNSTLNLLYKILNKFQIPNLKKSLDLTFKIPSNLNQFFLSLLMNLLTIGSLWFCFRTFGVAVPFDALMIGIPALTILLILPVSISGWGLRESTLSAVLLLWNVDPTLTIISSITYGLINLIVLLPGAYQILRD
jgi:uncharacterized membrane protein YbhN (UPF0104 family)